MALIRWNPWSLDRFFDEDFSFPTIPALNRVLDQGLNLYETDDAIVAEVAVPGIPEDRIDVSVDEDGIVRITASYEDKQEDRSKRRYFMSSAASSFNYAFRLPQGVVSDQEPMCEFDNGMLRLKFTKQQKQAPRKIKVSNKRKGGKEDGK